MTALMPVWPGADYRPLSTRIAGGIGVLDAKTTQNFVYHPLSDYDNILMTYGKNMHTQKFVYGATDKDKGLIKIKSYLLMGDRWDENSASSYAGTFNNQYAKETFANDSLPVTQYVIKDIRGSVEQLVSKWGYKALTYQYSAFGEELFPMTLNDIHVVPERNRVASVAP